MRRMATSQPIISSTKQVHWPESLGHHDDRETRGRVSRLTDLEKEQLYVHRADLRPEGWFHPGLTYFCDDGDDLSDEDNMCF